MRELTFSSHSEADTERLGAALARALPAGTTVALMGTLGAGKTRLVQAVAAALGVPREQATSSTFVVENELRAVRPIYPFDASRLRDEDE
ncbi:MAG TPA: tRNA (adenosine(37)-N6)-threonylcarbamoyltransferase complex ATPase subunit type 1 TsaE, partial [Lacipirellulaceae bacterium]|nr:tRNA (adenosine(37)-N6)-threonylcarbamoyltransferase complex ATPase subunit type 1 TsaE [Lacipirellulaceae bacterium]